MHYCDSKDDLFRACFKYCIERTVGTFRRIEGRHDDAVKMIAGWCVRPLLSSHK